MDEQLFQQLHGLHEVLRERNLPEEEIRFVVENLDATGATNDVAINVCMYVHPDEVVNRHRRPWNRHGLFSGNYVDRCIKWP
jgi:hypothetical protein